MMRQGDHINIIRFGTAFLPYEQWAKKFEEDYFEQFVSKTAMPLLEMNNYFISMPYKELADRLSYWAWEIYMNVRNGRAVSSLADMRNHKSKDQYVNYQTTISDAEWSDVCDDWETDFLFSQTSLEGAKQRIMLPDFLWKLAVDENGGGDDYESEEEVVEKQRQTAVSELGWVTNNRRNF